VQKAERVVLQGSKTNGNNWKAFYSPYQKLIKNSDKFKPGLINFRQFDLQFGMLISYKGQTFSSTMSRIS